MLDEDARIERTKKLLGFAAGVLTARDKVQMRMDQTRMGVFRETEIAALPGISVDAGDGTWLRLSRQQETRPRDPELHVKSFLSSDSATPNRKPELKPAIAVSVSIEEASDLAEAGLLRSENVHNILEDGMEREDVVRVTLLAQDLFEMLSQFGRWVSDVWTPWAERERPIRRSIQLYNALFRIHAVIHASEGVPPEIIWGFGLGTWRNDALDLDMPLVEQEVEIEIEPGGDLSLTPRERAPEVTLRPYIHADVSGSARLQGVLAELLTALRQGDTPFSPGEFKALEPIFEQAASRLDSEARFISITDRSTGGEIASPGPHLAVTSAWAIYVRPRSSAARIQDLQALAQAIEDEERVPEAIAGFVAPEPDKDVEDDPFDLDLEKLAGTSEPPGQKQERGGSEEPGMRTGLSDQNGATVGTDSVYFFPLAFNEEQARIVDTLEGKRGGGPRAPVVSVTGPPGTGKSHTIANLVSHAMARGRRVLVTARTAEAISVVRDKLPETLRGLTIASTGTDRQSIEQLKAAVSELSDEIASMDTTTAQRQREALEAQIVECDRVILEAEAALAEITKVNLETLPVGDREMTPMQLMGFVESKRDSYGWFTDRPKALPGDGTRSALERLRTLLPELAPDIGILGAKVPTSEELPSSHELIEAHEAERKASTRPQLDPSAFPPMVSDTEADLERARIAVVGLRKIERRISEAEAPVGAIIHAALEAESVSAFEVVLGALEDLRLEPAMRTVRYDRTIAELPELRAASLRGSAGQKPVGGIFNRTLKRAVETVRVDGAKPNKLEEWRVVERTIGLEDAAQSYFGEAMLALPTSIRPRLSGAHGWEIAAEGLRLLPALKYALGTRRELFELSDVVGALFPIGFDATPIRRGEVAEAAMAIEANLPDDYVPHHSLATLDTAAEGGTHELFARLRSLREALGAKETDPQDLIRERADLTQELSRIAELQPKLKSVGSDLNALAVRTPDWAERLRAAPQDAVSLIPESWSYAWNWAVLARRLDAIVSLGNGDEHRKRKLEAMRRRERYMVNLVKVRTMLGLRARMTSSVQRAMHAFTQAVARIGKGTGKTAPRYIRAAQAAARDVAGAAPVWIMPEHRIAEQLPPEIEAFDLVILDEASQSDITAVTALARGKQILVVGDEEQVSPSNVGIPVERINALRAEYLGDLPNADLIDENTSIFEITMRMFPQTHLILKEHFRSVAPIIQFSTQFYSKRLIPLRVAKASERFDPPLVDVFIDHASRKRQTNPAEARFVVNEIARILADPKHDSRDIGVVSLIGSDQAAFIQTMLLEDDRIGPERMAERRIICGDARTMQGQERSVMFLSMVATPEAVTSQTTKDTRQRLNVAMSRARDRTYLVRSVRMENLKNTDLKRLLLEHFQDPMPEGRKEAGTDLMDQCQSDFEREVLGLLLDEGYRVRPQVPTGAYYIDIVVEGANDRRLAIELDGDNYHPPEKWAEDMARQAALERAGWVFWRVFGSQWKAQKNRWWKDLLGTLERMGIEPIGAEAINDDYVERRFLDAVDYLEEATSASAEPHDEAPSPTLEEKLVVGTTFSGAAGEDLEEPDPVVAAAPETRGVNLRLFDHSEAPYDVRTDQAQTTEQSETVDDASVRPECQSDEANLGALVRLETSDGRRIQVVIVEEKHHDPEAGSLGEHTPLAQALIGAAAGDEVEYQAGPYLRTVRILAVRVPAITHAER